jgi:hypothetical protein
MFSAAAIFEPDAASVRGAKRRAAPDALRRCGPHAAARRGVGGRGMAGRRAASTHRRRNRPASNSHGHGPNCRFGGRRPWLTCSAHSNGRYCGRRVAMLYLAGELFACRRCCGLAYASQQKDPLVRNVSRSQKIRARLGGPCDLFGPIPERPRGMWPAPSRRSRAKSFPDQRGGSLRK